MNTYNARKQSLLAMRDFVKSQSVEPCDANLKRYIMQDGTDFTQEPFELTLPVEIPKWYGETSNMNGNIYLNNGAASSGNIGTWTGGQWEGGQYVNNFYRWSFEKLLPGSFQVYFESQWIAATSVAPAASPPSNEKYAIDVIFDLTTANGSVISLALTSLYIDQWSMYGNWTATVIALETGDTGAYRGWNQFKWTLDEFTEIQTLADGVSIEFAKPQNQMDGYRCLIEADLRQGDGYGSWDPNTIPVKASTFDFRPVSAMHPIVYSNIDFANIGDIISGNSNGVVMNIELGVIMVIDDTHINIMVPNSGDYQRLENKTIISLEKTEVQT